MSKNTDAEKRYFAETALALRREGYRVEQLDNGHLRVMLNDLPLCEVSEIGGIRYREEYVVRLSVWLKKTKSMESSASPPSICDR